MNIEQKPRQGETMPGIYFVFGTLLLMLFAYIKIVRPRQLTWGATAAEAAATLIGDEIVQHPHFVATHAVTIAAPPAEVWKWILQIGSARAGWYSLDPLDNGNVPSLWDILPEFQKIETGCFIPLSFPWLLYYLVYDFGDIVMMRKCLQGIKARAERAVAPVIAGEAVPSHS